MATPEETHSLDLRVLRLAKPEYSTHFASSFEPTDPLGVASSSSTGISALGLNKLWTLPQSFSSIPLGESFASYISVFNPTPFDVNEVSLKVELQTQTARFILLDVRDTTLPVFESGDSHDYLVNHDVKEAGVHILMCNVVYTRAQEKKSFNKFFKFMVVNPIEMVTHSHETSEGIVMAVEIKNNAAAPLYLDSVRLEPTSHFTVTDLNPHINSSVALDPINEISKVLQQLIFLKPQETKQFLFQLLPKTDSSIYETSMGRVIIVWRKTLGDNGRLHTGFIERQNKKPAFVMRVKKIPAEVALEKPFSAILEITNRSEHATEFGVLTIKNKIEAHSGILPIGLSRFSMPSLAAGGTHSLQVQFFAAQSGVQPLPEIVLKMTFAPAPNSDQVRPHSRTRSTTAPRKQSFSEFVHSYSNLADVFVTAEQVSTKATPSQVEPEEIEPQTSGNAVSPSSPDEPSDSLLHSSGSGWPQPQDVAAEPVESQLLHGSQDLHGEHVMPLDHLEDDSAQKKKKNLAAESIEHFDLTDPSETEHTHSDHHPASVHHDISNEMIIHVQPEQPPEEIDQSHDLAELPETPHESRSVLTSRGVQTPRNPQDTDIESSIPENSESSVPENSESYPDNSENNQDNENDQENENKIHRENENNETNQENENNIHRENENNKTNQENENNIHRENENNKTNRENENNNQENENSDTSNQESFNEKMDDSAQDSENVSEQSPLPKDE